MMFTFRVPCLSLNKKDISNTVGQSQNLTRNPRKQMKRGKNKPKLVMVRGETNCTVNEKVVESLIRYFDSK